MGCSGDGGLLSGTNTLLWLEGSLTNLALPGCVVMGYSTDLMIDEGKFCPLCGGETFLAFEENNEIVIPPFPVGMPIDLAEWGF